MICARARMLVAGIVNWLPTRVPKVPVGLPEAAAFASEQEADTIVKFVASVSVIRTRVPFVVAAIGAGVVG